VWKNTRPAEPENRRHGSTYADAVVDRIVHDAERIELVGDNMRRTALKPAVRNGRQPVAVTRQS
jgi:DNA replication protein DnaC